MTLPRPRNARKATLLASDASKVAFLALAGGGPGGTRGQSGQEGWRFSRKLAMPSRAPGLCDIDAITSTAIA